MSSNPPKPSKLFYRIGEVSRITGLEPYVLRYWETEFPQIKPDKGNSKQRLYKKKDLDTILEIKNLLYKEGFTISGARKKLNGRGEPDRQAVIEAAKKELREILDILK
ncbi:MAG: MerR family transcriptional regulator [Nitrospirae bacterium GWD2_57_9]|nr:MAG: MerR family transcriptional regulator [Nitrospirae bacterium GWD2_57_9]OGW45246.1 MAG: MerR family transcriptional regulator [Nitrospirae bacterium GWC2_57_9]